ncbi:MAG: hypothetical protein KKF46_01755 [Nanoarchaeota archaeon]|nr:hypothetical protein [Nanoarchaeota archaeon]MBU1321057.1 hypothetical protein [Nanoarchaeota archaeon]MBU1598126.1 hypothetical protein [Nanoarchaeota archaeon]MBU2442310.1 hypothetical protein [Nanoarchaeota archaeon]
MNDEIDLLEELNEEEALEEIVVLAADMNPVRKISKILEAQQPRFGFDELTGTNLPDTSLAYYFANDIDKKKAKQMIAKDPEKAFSDFIRLKYTPNHDSLISRLAPETSPLHLLKDYTKNIKKDKVKKAKIEPHVLQYIGTNVISSMAAQNLLEKIPFLASQVDKLDTPDDLSNTIVYSQLVSSARNDDVKNRLLELSQDKLLTSNEMLYKGVELFFAGECSNYFKLLESIKNEEKVNKGLVENAMIELFGHDMNVYEQAACLSELVDDPKIVRSIFAKNDVYNELNKHKRAHDRAEPDFAALFKAVISEYSNQAELKLNQTEFKFEAGYYFKPAKIKDHKENLKVRVKKGSEYYDEYKGIIGKTDSCTCNSGATWEINFKGDTKCLKISDLEIAINKDNQTFPKKLNHNGYENLCTQFLLEEAKQEDVFRAGVKVKIVKSGDNYTHTKNGSWGYVKRDGGGKIDIEFHHFTGDRHGTPYIFDIQRNHVELINPKKKVGNNSFEQIKESFESKGKVGEYLARTPILNMISEKLDKVFMEVKK